MIITKIRLQEEHPMRGVDAPDLVWPVPFLDLELNSSAGNNGYLIKNAVGLGPTQLTAVVVGFDTIGTPVYDSEAEKRELALRIQLTPQLGQTPSELRDTLYKFMSKGIVISLMNGSRVVAKTNGFIKMFEALHFTSQPEIQITIECETGYFEAPYSLDIPLAGLEATQPVITYEEGTAPTGFTLEFTVTYVEPRIHIANHSRAWHAGQGEIETLFEVWYQMIPGDVVTLSTHPTDKRVSLVRAGVTIDMAGYINAGAVWPKLYPGVNIFEWFMANSWMTFNSMSYIPRYWGV